MAISFDDWKKKKLGVPSGTPEVSTQPLDTGEGPRPRLTFEQWQESKQSAPMLSPETVEAVAQAPQPAPQPEPEPVAAPAPTVPELNPYVTGGSFGTGIEQIEETARAAGEQVSPETKEGVREFVRDEGLPIVGGTVAALALPATATAGFTGWLLAAGVSGAGSTAGEFIEQSMKKIGAIDAPPEDTPTSWGEVAAASVSQGAEDGAFTAATDGVLRLVPKGLRAAFTFGARLKDDTKHMVNVLREKGGPVLASDVADSVVINYANSAATYSFTQAGQKIAATRQTQAEILGKAAQEPLTGLIERAGVDVADEYMEAGLKSLPDDVLASHLSSVIKDGERAAKDVAGTLYTAMSEASYSMGTRMVRATEYIDTGRVDAFQKPIYQIKETMQEMPLHTVDVKDARKVLEDEITELAKDLTPEAAADYSKYAKSQLRLFSFNDEISVPGAVNHIKSMSADARALARSSDEGASTKRMWLLKSIDKLQEAMDITAKEMADAGLTVGGRSVTEVKREADKLWRGANEDFGNKYVQQMLGKADATEGAAATLAGSFMQNRESADAIMGALEAAEKAGQQVGKFGLDDTVGKTRAAIGAKVYENMLSKVIVAGEDTKALMLLNAPDSRKALLRLLGNDNLELLDTSVRSLVEAKGKGLNVGAFTQFARESAVLSDIPASAEKLNKFIATLSMPRLLSKGLRSESIVKKLTDANFETNLSKKGYIFNQIIKESIQLEWEDYEKMTPEEVEKLNYRNRLASM